MTYWLRLRDDRPGMEEHWVALPMSWLWEFPIVAWKLRRAWARSEEALASAVKRDEA